MGWDGEPWKEKPAGPCIRISEQTMLCCCSSSQCQRKTRGDVPQPLAGEIGTLAPCCAIGLSHILLNWWLLVLCFPWQGVAWKAGSGLGLGAHGWSYLYAAYGQLAVPPHGRSDQGELVMDGRLFCLRSSSFGNRLWGESSVWSLHVIGRPNYTCLLIFTLEICELHRVAVGLCCGSLFL